MNPLYVIDLDDNIGQTLKNCPPGETPLEPMAIDRSGKPLCFMTPKQQAMFKHLSLTGSLLPCTGRNREKFSRMVIAFNGYAIVAYGGAILLPTGGFEPGWRSYVLGQAAGIVNDLDRLRTSAQALVDMLGYDIDLEILGEDFEDGVTTPLYIEAKLRGGEKNQFDHLERVWKDVQPKGWKFHRNGHTMTSMPSFLGKTPALSYFLQEINPPRAFTVGMGDSTTDGDFMALCDYAMMPVRSQIFRLLKEAIDVSR